MQLMITLSLLLNIGVLIPVCAGLFRNADWVVEVYGEPTPARDILLAFYLAVGLASVVLLVHRDTDIIFAMLIFQVVYKLISPITVKSVKNPVVIGNIIAASFHICTLAVMWIST